MNRETKEELNKEVEARAGAPWAAFAAGEKYSSLTFLNLEAIVIAHLLLWLSCKNTFPYK